MGLLLGRVFVAASSEDVVEPGNQCTADQGVNKAKHGADSASNQRWLVPNVDYAKGRYKAFAV